MSLKFQFFMGGNWEDVQANIPANALCVLVEFISSFLNSYRSVWVHFRSCFRSLFSTIKPKSTTSQNWKEGNHSILTTLAFWWLPLMIQILGVTEFHCISKPNWTFCTVFGCGAGWRMQAMLLVQGYWNFFAIVKRYARWVSLSTGIFNVTVCFSSNFKKWKTVWWGKSRVRDN